MLKKIWNWFIGLLPPVPSERMKVTKLVWRANENRTYVRRSRSTTEEYMRVRSDPKAHVEYVPNLGMVASRDVEIDGVMYKEEVCLHNRNL